MATFIDLSGQRFRKLLAVKLIRNNGKPRWECRCDCGKNRLVRGSMLREGRTKSCGCLVGEVRRPRAIPGAMIGGKVSPEYIIWAGMKARCSNPKHDRYGSYGGRGIKVCARWMKFENFLADMGQRPNGRYSIERKNTDGDYEPSNCIWLPLSKQARNTTVNRRITFNGETLCIAEWAERLGLSQSTLTERLEKWTLERALTEPCHSNKGRKR